MKGTLAGHLQGQLGISSLQHQSSSSISSSNPSNRFQNYLESVDENSALSVDVDAYVDDKETILTQDFFWYISFHFFFPLRKEMKISIVYEKLMIKSI